jgi:hypothetical protein
MRRRFKDEKFRAVIPVNIVLIDVFIVCNIRI